MRYRVVVTKMSGGDGPEQAVRRYVHTREPVRPGGVESAVRRAVEDAARHMERGGAVSGMALCKGRAYTLWWTDHPDMRLMTVRLEAVE